MTTERFIQDSAYRHQLVRCELDYYDWPTLDFKEIQLDTSNLPYGDTASYYYFNSHASMLVLVWIYNPKKEFLFLKNYINYALTFTANLIEEDLPEIANVEQVLVLFYSAETHKFLPQYCELSRRNLV